MSPFQYGVNLGCRFFRIRICQLDRVVEAHRVVVRLHASEHGVSSGGRVWRLRVDTISLKSFKSTLLLLIQSVNVSQHFVGIVVVDIMLVDITVSRHYVLLVDIMYC